jgi:hypothetical protein
MPHWYLYAVILVEQYINAIVLISQLHIKWVHFISHDE